MKELNYWQQFLNTGSIDDYLEFRKKAGEEYDSPKRSVMGENPYAGICKVNRDGFEDGAYR